MMTGGSTPRAAEKISSIVSRCFSGNPATIMHGGPNVLSLGAENSFGIMPLLWLGSFILSCCRHLLAALVLTNPFAVKNKRCSVIKNNLASIVCKSDNEYLVHLAIDC